MERNANYALVGFFVLVFVGSIAGFIYWLGKYGNEQVEFDHYKTYFSESVSGLNKESPVKFKGVNIGSVEAISIDQTNSERIEVRLKVAKNTPIKVDSFVALGSQGLTGLAYLEIKGGKHESQRLLAKNTELPEIKSEMSLITKLSDKAENVSNQAIVLMDKINKLLSDKNLNNVESILSNLQLLSNELKNTRQEIKSLVSNGIEIEKKGASAVDKLTTTIDNINVVIQNSNDTLGEIKDLSREGKSFVKNLKDSPSDLVFKQKYIKPGPGE